MFHELKDLLGEFLDDHDISQGDGPIRVAWEKAVGQTIVRNTEIVRFQNGLLTVKTSNPVWRNELSLRKQEIKAVLEKELTTIKIKDIRFV